jgi:hypothetical protein
MTFQSRFELAVFVENKMPSNSFSMFQDMVTLWKDFQALMWKEKRS